jgi:4-hydroxybenzoate polyprenyltransferase/phosphoserine phosphatase
MPQPRSENGRLETSPRIPSPPPAPVLVVDLDGTLLQGDLLWESFLAYVAPAPWRVANVVGWIVKGGRPGLKARLAEAVMLDGKLLPWNEDIITFCESQSRAGAEIVIATASNQHLAHAVTRQFGFVSRVIGSDEFNNLKGTRKAERLTAEFGASGFDYVGDSSADLPVWQAAKNAWFVGRPSRRADLARQLGKPLGNASPRGVSLRRLLPAMRPHQWLKNLLVFFPLLAAHRWTDTASWRLTVPVFFALCCMASASYLLNDLSDLAADRRHARKKFRPLASGDLAIPAGVGGMAVLFVLGIALGGVAGPTALAATLAYFLLSVIYSFGVKTVPILDTLFLSGLYTYRMVLGGIAASVLISSWLLAFSTTFFLGLAFLKRFVEIEAMAPADLALVPGRGYGRGDLGFVLVAGVASSFLSVVVLALYLESTASRALYASPQWLWGIALVMLCWNIRVWFLASRKQMHDDPVWFAAKDWVTFGLAAACVAFVAAARPV